MNISLLGVPPLSPLYATSVLLKVPPSLSRYLVSGAWRSRCSSVLGVPGFQVFQGFQCSRCSIVPVFQLFQMFQCSRCSSFPRCFSVPDVQGIQVFRCSRCSSVPVLQCSSVQGSALFQCSRCSSAPGVPALQCCRK